MTSLLSFVLAQAPGQPDPLQNMLSTILPFAAIILIFYFMMIRPQQKRQKEMKSMLDAMKKGDKVITSSGIHGTITDIEDNVITVQIAENTKVRFEKVAVTTVINK
ncbi:MAG: preprotein translocase subunit YajC [Candidatus Kapaibacterium sp.]